MTTWLIAALIVVACAILNRVRGGCGGLARDLWVLGECAVYQNDINKRCQ